MLDEPSSETEGETHDNVLSDPAFAFGTAFTVTVVVATLLVHPFTVTVREYVPAIAALALAFTEGSSSEELKPFGPVQL